VVLVVRSRREQFSDAGQGGIGGGMVWGAGVGVGVGVGIRASTRTAPIACHCEQKGQRDCVAREKQQELIWGSVCVWRLACVG
jgi:hypothetical protein